MTNEFSPTENKESGTWSCRKYMGASTPLELGEFNDRLSAQMACVHLNILAGSMKILREQFNLDLTIKERQ